MLLRPLWPLCRCWLRRDTHPNSCGSFHSQNPLQPLIAQLLLGGPFVVLVTESVPLVRSVGCALLMISVRLAEGIELRSEVVFDLELPA